MNTCEFVVERLLEIRVNDGYRCVADVERMMAMMRECVSSLPHGEKYVIAADWRNVGVMAPETSIRARQMLEASNPRVIRSSMLLREGRATAQLQVLRLLREANNPDRRHFTSTQILHAWLSEVLSVREAERLAVFLGLSQSQMTLGT